MAKKVCLDFGHGGSDPGAVNGKRTEKADVLRIGLKVRDFLTAQGVNVVLTRTSDADVSINDRCKIANAAKCDYFLSIHRNAASPDATGNEIWVHSKAVAHVADKAQKILNAVCAVYGKNRGVKKGAAGNYTDYGVNRDTDMPSALLELGFITSSADNKSFDSNIDAYAKAITKGICAALGVDYKEPQPSPAPSTGGKIEKGDIVQFAGGKVYASSTATTAASTRGASKCKVTATAPGAKHPYHCISEDGKGVYGWVDAVAIEQNGGEAPVQPENTYAKGRTVRLNNVSLYGTASAKTASGRKTGTYYIYDGVEISGRYRITTSAANCGKTPAGNYVTGYINKSDIR